MASRAHVHDYYGHAPERPRRAVRYPGRSDPVILPGEASRGSNAILMVSAFVATAVIVGGAFAVYAGVPAPPMAETPTMELARNYQLDEQPLRAQTLQALSGPASGVPNLGTVQQSAEDTEASVAPARSEPIVTPRSEPVTGPRQAPPPAPAVSDQLPPSEPTYPDPSTTPPDAVAPPGASPEAPVPLLDPENPYR
jgi:hypothetical protein